MSLYLYITKMREKQKLRHIQTVMEDGVITEL